MICFILLGFGIAGYISGIIIVMFMLLYVGYVIISLLLAQKNTTRSYEHFIDFGSDRHNPNEENFDFKRNLFVEKQQNDLEDKNAVFKINSLSIEKNVISHNFKNRV